MVILDLDLCLLSIVENQISDWDVTIRHFLKDTALDITYFASIQLGWTKVSFVTYLVEKREYSNNKDGLKIFVHFVGMY